MSVAPSSPVNVPTPPYTPDHILAPVTVPVDSPPVAPPNTQTPPSVLKSETDARRPPPPSYPPPVIPPPPSSPPPVTSSPVHVPVEGQAARFLTVEQQKIMPPIRSTNPNTLPRTEAELNERISRAIVQNEALCSEHSGGTSGNNPPTGCTYKQFLDCNPLNFDGTRGAAAFIRWVEKTNLVLRMSKCSPEQRVTYISRLFMDGALSWWNLQVQTLGEAAAYALSWDELKELMRKKYCSRVENQKLETEFWNLKMDGPKISEYIQRFHDLSRVVPYLVEAEFKRIERFIW
ncbi:SR-related and CTD-associated factor 4-like [Helianthus annuus]|uniref:SR-related and CTD-associated factor 4-like n=1 Tax=Helianthus annuus TaxID=4232 RepID=UPI000B8FCB9A|nr:SR-related and CTD-associated factor 4-like [Helianthus annuus]